MKVNLDFLKFHHFNYNKNINNLWIKRTEEIKNKIIEDIFLKKLIYLISFENFSIFSSKNKDSNNFHNFDYNHKSFLFKVISICHPNLYKDIQERFLEKDNLISLNVYQISLTNLSRLIFIYSDCIIYPLILDLNHCFYKTKNTYDNNSKAKKYEWDFKNEQKVLKLNILNKLKYIFLY